MIFFLLNLKSELFVNNTTTTAIIFARKDFMNIIYLECNTSRVRALSNVTKTRYKCVQSLSFPLHVEQYNIITPMFPDQPTGRTISIRLVIRPLHVNYSGAAN